MLIYAPKLLFDDLREHNGFLKPLTPENVSESLISFVVLHFGPLSDLKELI